MERLLNIDEAAKLCGLKKSTLYLYTSRRIVPHHKIGKRILFSEKQLEKWIKSHEVKEVNVKEIA